MAVLCSKPCSLRLLIILVWAVPISNGVKLASYYTFVVQINIFYRNSFCFRCFNHVSNIHLISSLSNVGKHPTK